MGETNALTEAWLYILYGVFAVGAAGLCGAMPTPGRRSPRAAAVLMLGAAAGLIVFGVRGAGWSGGRDFYFYAFGMLALFGAARVVTHARPVYSALYFVVVVLAVAGLLVLADAPFLAAALVIIYAGAILVTYLFVIMLAQQNEPSACDVSAREPLAAVVIAFLLVACVGSLLADQPAAAPGTFAAPPSSAAAEAGNVRELGRVLLTQYAVAVEVGGVLLLVAMVGAIWIARRSVPGHVTPPDAELKPPGQIGREVPPF